jgi:glutamyl-tRNA synthetase
MSNFVTRFAPSPTGFLHIGNLRTAAIAWLFCRQNHGKFILRIENTDFERSKKEYEDQMKIDLKNSGLFWDEEFSQSARFEIYNEYIEYLKKKGFIYECFESKEDLDLLRKTASNMKKNFIYDRSKALNLNEEEQSKQKNRSYYRFKLNHGQKISWNDLIKGQINFDPTQISDPVVIRQDGSFTFLLISVIDDILMKISHVIRGEDHISNTASQIQMFEAFDGFEGYDFKKSLPNFAHLPLLKMPEGKISKRTGGFEVFNLLNEGILPVSLINYLMSLGSNLSGAAEAELDMQNLIKNFDICSYGTASPNFNQKDLERLNLKNIQIFSDAEALNFFNKNFEKEGLNFNFEYWKIYKNNLEKLSDILHWQKLFEILEGKKYIQFLKSESQNSLESLEECNQNEYEKFINDEQNKTIIKTGKEILENDSELKESFEGSVNQKTWSIFAEKIFEKIKNSEISKKHIFLCLRFFLTGKNFGPEMNLFIRFFGYKKILEIFSSLK